MHACAYNFIGLTLIYKWFLLWSALSELARNLQSILQLCAWHHSFGATGPYFTAVDLANFARELDEDERIRMAEGGLDSPQYLRYCILYRHTHCLVVVCTKRYLHLTQSFLRMHEIEWYSMSPDNHMTLCVIWLLVLVYAPHKLRFLKQPSSNMDDSGFFSVQVWATLYQHVLYVCRVYSPRNLIVG